MSKDKSVLVIPWGSLTDVELPLVFPAKELLAGGFVVGLMVGLSLVELPSVSAAIIRWLAC